MSKQKRQNLLTLCRQAWPDIMVQLGVVLALGQMACVSRDTTAVSCKLWNKVDTPLSFAIVSSVVPDKEMFQGKYNCLKGKDGRPR